MGFKWKTGKWRKKGETSGKIKIKHKFLHVLQGECGKKTAIENNIKVKSKVLWYKFSAFSSKNVFLFYSD